jgi:Ca2+-binding EF-hand superfamily protein
MKHDQLIDKAFAGVKKDLSISDKNPQARLNQFQKKLDAAQPSLIYRLKEVWQVLLALTAGFFTIGFMMAKLSLTSGLALQTASLDQHDFNMFDADMNGKLNYAEALAAREMLIIEQFQALDHNRDALLSSDEAQVVLASYNLSKCSLGNSQDCSTSPDAQLATFDTDQDQHICYTEFYNVLAQLDPQFFDYLDQNKDGELNYNEAKHLAIKQV